MLTKKTANTEVSEPNLQDLDKIDAFLKASKPLDVSKYPGRESELTGEVSSGIMKYDAINDISEEIQLHTILTEELDPTAKVEKINIDIPGLEAKILNSDKIDDSEKKRYLRASRILKDAHSKNFSIVGTSTGKYWFESDETGEKNYVTNGILEVADLLNYFGKADNSNKEGATPRKNKKVVVESVQEDYEPVELEDYEYWGLAALGVDLGTSGIALGAKLTGVGAVPGAITGAAGGVVATILDVVGDIKNPNLDGWDVLTNAGMRVGLEALETVTVLPASVATIFKRGATANKIIKKGLQAAFIAGVIDNYTKNNYLDIIKRGSEDITSLTMEDYRGIAGMGQALMGIAGSSALRTQTKRKMSKNIKKGRDTEGMEITAKKEVGIPVRGKKESEADFQARQTEYEKNQVRAANIKAGTEVNKKTSSLKHENTRNVLKVKKDGKAEISKRRKANASAIKKQKNEVEKLSGEKDNKIKEIKDKLKKDQEALQKSKDSKLSGAKNPSEMKAINTEAYNKNKALQDQASKDITAIENNLQAASNKLKARKKVVKKEVDAIKADTKKKVDDLNNKLESNTSSIIAKKDKKRKQALVERKNNKKNAVKDKVDKTKSEIDAELSGLEKNAAEDFGPSFSRRLKKKATQKVLPKKEYKALQKKQEAAAKKVAPQKNPYEQDLKNKSKDLDDFKNNSTDTYKKSSEYAAKLKTKENAVEKARKKAASRKYKAAQDVKNRLNPKGSTTERVFKKTSDRLRNIANAPISRNNLKPATKVLYTTDLFTDITGRDKKSRDQMITYLEMKGADETIKKLSNKELRKEFIRVMEMERKKARKKSGGKLIIKSSNRVRKAQLGSGLYKLYDTIGVTDALSNIYDNIIDKYKSWTAGQKNTGSVSGSWGNPVKPVEEAEEPEKPENTINTSKNNRGTLTNYELKELAKKKKEQVIKDEKLRADEKAAKIKQYDAIIEKAKTLPPDRLNSMEDLEKLFSSIRISDVFNKTSLFVERPVIEDLKATILQSNGVNNMQGYTQAVNSTRLIPKTDTSDSFADATMKKEFHKSGLNSRAELARTNAQAVSASRDKALQIKNANAQNAMAVDNENTRRANAANAAFASNMAQARAIKEREDNKRRGRLANGIVRGLSLVAKSKRRKNLNKQFNTASSLKNKWNVEYKDAYDAAFKENNTLETSRLKADFIKKNGYNPDDLDKYMLDTKADYNHI